ncbi:MAG: WYL domain-containing protein, partial [Clostridia bacterium]|nr:WYL domain-containing protein [Clostridia bacterium]
MARSAHQQEKLLWLQRIFLQETDEAHPLTMQQLIARLEQQGISAERKSLYLNIETLNQCGMEIIAERRGSQTVYYSAGGDFEAAELRLLADAVASSRFITAKKSGELLKKLEGLTSRHYAAGLRRQVHVPSRIKNMNETIFYLVDELNRAIAKNVSIEFCYYDWVAEGQTLRRVARHEGQRYEVSPWQLLWEDEFYYLIAFDHRSRSIRHYRVDRMGDISPTDRHRQGDEE